jgi:aromatic-L-amino-acid decarboxylase
MMLHRNEFRKNADPVLQWIESYLNNIEAYPVKSMVRPGEIYQRIPGSAPEDPEPLDQILADLEEVILPGITHWQHPNFHAYFPANSSVESLLAEFVTATIGAQCMIWDTSPAAAELEQRMTEWLRDAMDLPSGWEGVIQDSASSATLVALLTAREVVTGFRANQDGVPDNLRVYCSEETHSSIEKAVGICGIGRKNLVKIAVDGEMRMKPGTLEDLIKADLERGLQPMAVVATIGTTGTMAVDPLPAIAGICRKYGIWLHVDAAYAGTALLLPEYRWMAEGMEEADSFVFNPHKWMFTNFDCSVYFVRDVKSLIRTFEILPEYLKTDTRGAVNDYRDWGVPLGRRFRALKLWFVIRSYGLEGLREKIREHIRLGTYFSREVLKIPGVETVTEPFLNFCCFRIGPVPASGSRDADALNQELLERINRGGKLFLTHTRVRGVLALRMVIGQTYTEKRHVDLALHIIKESVNEGWNIDQAGKA